MDVTKIQNRLENRLTGKLSLSLDTTCTLL